MSSDNNVEDKGAMKLAEALKFNTTLVELNLDSAFSGSAVRELQEDSPFPVSRQ